MASGSTVTLEHAPVATPEGPEAARGMKRKRSGMGKVSSPVYLLRPGSLNA